MFTNALNLTFCKQFPREKLNSFLRGFADKRNNKSNDVYHLILNTRIILTGNLKFTDIADQTAAQRFGAAVAEVFASNPKGFDNPLHPNY